MANQAFRQEFNIICAPMTSTGNLASNGYAIIDQNTFSGAPTYWLEIVHSGAVGNTGTITVALFDNLQSIAGATSATKILSRVQLTPVDNLQQNAQLSLVGDGVRSQTVYAARIVVLQNEATITQTETQIEIGNDTSAAPQTNTAVADITSPKFWKYNSANWDGTKTFFVEVVWKTSAKNTTTITLCRTSDNAANVTVVSAGTNSTAFTNTRVAFTPVNGETYKLRALSSSTKSSYSIACAKIGVTQSYVPTDSQLIGETAENLNGGSGTTNEQLGQSFNASSSYNVSNVALALSKSGSPTDNLTLEILSGSMTGTVLGTSTITNPTALVGGSTPKWLVFNFSSPVSLTNATKYYLRLSRSGGTDATNKYQWRESQLSVLASAGAFRKNSGSWNLESTTDDFAFKVFPDPFTGLLKLEPQFLLLNKADAGTGAQSIFTTYTSSEWNVGVGTNTITHLVDSDNASNSAKIVTAAGADTGTSSAATGSIQPESSSFSLITATNYDTNVTNSTGTVAASRLKFAYVYVVDTSSSIKTIVGLAKASVKTVDGLAIASVKTAESLA